jgi:ADP-ribose pyrophosphatase YjhB (NUDIX family)
VGFPLFYTQSVSVDANPLEGYNPFHTSWPKGQEEIGRHRVSSVIRRRRGTAIVETDRGILLTSRNGKVFILPGGGAERDESRFVAALRELTEETGLRPYHAEIIFRHLGKVQKTLSGRRLFQDHHTVCLVKATGEARPGGGDSKHIAYYYAGCNVKISTTTREIIEKYYQWKLDKERSKNNPIADDEVDE